MHSNYFHPKIKGSSAIMLMSKQIISVVLSFLYVALSLCSCPIQRSILPHILGAFPWPIMPAAGDSGHVLQSGHSLQGHCSLSIFKQHFFPHKSEKPVCPWRFVDPKSEVIFFCDVEAPTVDGEFVNSAQWEQLPLGRPNFNLFLLDYIAGGCNSSPM